MFRGVLYLYFLYACGGFFSMGCVGVLVVVFLFLFFFIIFFPPPFKVHGGEDNCKSNKLSVQ